MSNATSNEQRTVGQLVQQVQAQMKEEDYEEALESVRLLLARDDTSYQHWLLEGAVRVALGEWRPAERAYQRACQVASEEPTVWLQWANLALILGDPLAAEERAAKALALSLSPDIQAQARAIQAEALLSSAQARLAALLDETQEPAGIAEAPRESDLPVVTEYNPQAGEIGEGYGTPPLADAAVFDMLQRGLTALEQALAVERKSPELWDLQGSYLTLLGRPKEAAKAWQQATRLAPQEAQYWHELAMTLESLRNFTEAQAAYQRVHELDTLRGEEDVAFLFDEFLEWANQAWQQVEEEWLGELALDVPLVVQVMPYPMREQVDRAKHDELFDPRTPFFIDTTRDAGKTVIQITLYHRNIEREAATTNPSVLFSHLTRMLEEIMHTFLDTILEEEP